jgi:hypothetical protein
LSVERLAVRAYAGVAVEVHSPTNILNSASVSCERSEKIRNGEVLSQKKGCTPAVELIQVVYQMACDISALQPDRIQDLCV